MAKTGCRLPGTCSAKNLDARRASAKVASATTPTRRSGPLTREELDGTGAALEGPETLDGPPPGCEGPEAGAAGGCVALEMAAPPEPDPLSDPESLRDSLPGTASPTSSALGGTPGPGATDGDGRGASPWSTRGVRSGVSEGRVGTRPDPSGGAGSWGRPAIGGSSDSTDSNASDDCTLSASWPTPSASPPIGERRSPPSGGAGGSSSSTTEIVSPVMEPRGPSDPTPSSSASAPALELHNSAPAPAAARPTTRRNPHLADEERVPIEGSPTPGVPPQPDPR